MINNYLILSFVLFFILTFFFYYTNAKEVIKVGSNDANFPNLKLKRFFFEYFEQFIQTYFWLLVRSK